MTQIQLKKLHGQVSVTIARESGYVDLVFKGAVNREILDEAFLKLIEDPMFSYNLNALYDYSHAYSEMQMPEIEEHAQFISQNLSRRGSSYKLALVAMDTFNVALLEVYKLLISKTSVDAEVFTNKLQAIHWLTDHNR